MSVSTSATEIPHKLELLREGLPSGLPFTQRWKSDQIYPGISYAFSLPLQVPFDNLLLPRLNQVLQSSVSESRGITAERNFQGDLILHIHFTDEKLRPTLPILQLYSSSLDLELRFSDTLPKK